MYREIELNNGLIFPILLEFLFFKGRVGMSGKYQMNNPEGADGTRVYTSAIFFLGLQKYKLN